MNFRIGHGYDVHRLVEDRALIVGGEHIPYHLGLLGHSDADVVCHAIADALLGAAGLRDIGYYFPDRDERFRGISSLVLLTKVAELLNSHDYKIGNIDATIIAQAPKMAPYLEKMKENIAKSLSIDTYAVNIKATTEEKLGFTGKGEGISTHAVCLIYRTNN